MSEKFKTFLMELNTLIGELEERDTPIMECSNVMEIRQMYGQMKLSGETALLDQYIEDLSVDLEQSLLFQSILLRILQEDFIFVNILKLLLEKDLDLFLTANIFKQWEGETFFQLRAKGHYELRRKLQKKISSMFWEKLGCTYEYIPVTERNKKSIVIVTEQLLSYKHGPSYIIYEISSILQKVYGLHVLILVANCEFDKNTYNYWNQPFELNIDESMMDNFLLNYNGEKLLGYQICLSEDNLGKLKLLLDDIYRMKPLFVWSIGGNILANNLLNPMTTALSMPCQIGYAVSDAPYLVSYLDDRSEELGKVKNYIDKCDQKRISLKLRTDHRSEFHGTLMREDIGCTEDDFLISIVGNRLNYEITTEFIDILDKILESHDSIRFIIIGEFDYKNKFKQYSSLKQKSIFLGYRHDLIDILNLVDLFLNQIGKGGGGAASKALAMGKPIITLNKGDTAVGVGKEFTCNFLEEMPGLVEKYRLDKVFYKLQSQRAKDKYKEREAERLPEFIGEMLEQIDQEEGWDVFTNRNKTINVLP